MFSIEPTDDPFARFLGASPAAAEARDFGRRAARVDAPVLLTGESGTGKGLLARAIHDASRRARSTFVAVNCAGVPESLFESEFFGYARGAFTGAQQPHRGLFEQADRGTLFLDEIGELALSMQAKLLCALEDGEIRRLGAERPTRVDARLIAATGVGLEDAVQRRLFRRDLYHRLLVLSYRLPPLRERAGDVELFAHVFLDAFARRHGRGALRLSPGALASLRAHSWPGNVRELAHAVEAAVLRCDEDTIGEAHVRAVLSAAGDAGPSAPPGRGRYSAPAGDDEKARIVAAMELHGGNKSRAAQSLGMARNTLRAKLKEHGCGQWSRNGDGQ